MRVKYVVPRRHRRKKILKQAKGYYGAQSRSTKIATQQVLRAQRHAYQGRKQKKRDFRRLWIARINAAARSENLKYSEFIWALKQIKTKLSRKSLATLAFSNPEEFKSLCEEIKNFLKLKKQNQSPKLD